MRNWLLLSVAGCLQLGCELSTAPTGTIVVTSTTSSGSEAATAEVTPTSSDQSDGTFVGPFATFDFSSLGEFTGPRLPVGTPPIVQEEDPCGVLNCDVGRGCCHNPQAFKFNALPQEFLVDCLPEPVGQQNAPLDSTCGDYRCETLYCLWKGCRLDSGQCGVRADEYLLPGGGDIAAKTVPLAWGCVDERWLIRRNESGVPPDPTLECAAEYWWPEAGAPGQDAAVSSVAPNGGSPDAGSGLSALEDAAATSGLDASL